LQPGAGSVRLPQMSELTLECTARSDIGRRKNNEDAVYASPRLAAVADGVGGAAAGEVASGWIIQALQHLDKSKLGGPLELALRDAIAWGNETIGFVGQNRPHMSGMSTTLTAVALANDGTYSFANIGDSRTYLLRDGELKQLTRDDSFVQHMIDEGHLTVEQARRHPSLSLVLEALDGKPDRRAVITTLAACAEDRLLLCSDGLSDVVELTALRDVLTAHESRPECVDALVHLALESGARDNVSAIVIDVVPRSDPATAWQSQLDSSSTTTST
jgi:serine/threonine protein phosphatase PrpC